MQTDKYKYIKYNDFWQNSFQRLDSLTNTIEQDLHKLEKKYFDFDRIYDEIMTNMNILSSIYSCHNNLKGTEYILKLKAILNNYKKRYTTEGIDFKTLYFLKTKINTLREISFEDFPGMQHTYVTHTDISDGIGTLDANIRRYNELKKSSRFKWVTFFRHGSWFIAPCGELNIIESSKAEIADDSGNSIKYNGEILPVTELFTKYAAGHKEHINYFVIIENGGMRKCYAAGKLGKILMANKNFVIHRLNPFIKSRISAGKIRLFGKNHVYVK